jgi:hypothetical protein
MQCRSPGISYGAEIGIGSFKPDGEAEGHRVAPVDERSIGGPTDTLERMVESKEISAHFTASFRLVLGWMMRSRIGLPYFTSPIWK